MMPKSLYLMYCPNLATFKIGISHNVEGRRKSVQRSVGNFVDVAFTLECYSAKDLEETFHRLFRKKRLNQGVGNGASEWFKLDKGDIQFYFHYITLHIDEAKSLPWSNLKFGRAYNSYLKEVATKAT